MNVLDKFSARLKEGRTNLTAGNTLKAILFSFWCLTLASVAVSYLVLDLTPAEYVSVIREFIARQGVWAPVLYIFFYSFRSLIFFPASVLTILSGILFGPIFGFLFTMVGENISANMSFLVGRYFTSNLADRLNNKNPYIARLLQCSQENGFVTVLLLRLAFVPFDLVGYCSGICKLRQKDFALGTLLGTIPGLLTFTLLGSSVLDKRLMAISLATFLVSFFIARRLKKNPPQCFLPSSNPTLL